MEKLATETAEAEARIERSVENKEVTTETAEAEARIERLVETKKLPLKWQRQKPGLKGQ